MTRNSKLFGDSLKAVSNSEKAYNDVALTIAFVMIFNLILLLPFVNIASKIILKIPKILEELEISNNPDEYLLKADVIILPKDESYVIFFDKEQKNAVVPTNMDRAFHKKFQQKLASKKKILFEVVFEESITGQVVLEVLTKLKQLAIRNEKQYQLSLPYLPEES
jgi:hypothetical protein